MAAVTLSGFNGIDFNAVISAIMQSEMVELAMVADFDEKRRSVAARNCPGVEITNDAAELIADRTIDVVAIATPISSHYPLALAALRAGKPVGRR